MSADVVDPRSAVRRVEFDLLDGEVASPRSSPPEADWFESHVPDRPRVLRDNASGVGTYELPALDIASGAAGTTGLHRAGASSGHSGAASIAWAAGHRDGLEQGRAEGLALGYAEGVATGSAAGRDRALRDGHAAADTALRALDDESRRTLDQLVATTEEVASSAASLAFQIAELVLEREVELSADPGAEAGRRAARLLPDTGAAELATLTARLHPDDLDRLTAQPAELVAGRSLQVLADPAVAPGGCVLECGATRVDATIPSALDRIRAALGLATPGPETLA